MPPKTQNCRICLIKQEQNNYKQIHEDAYKSQNIYHMILYCLPQMSPIKKSIESIICLHCLERLYQCYDFISMCYQNDENFKINNQLDDGTNPNSEGCNASVGTSERALPSANKPKKTKFQFYRTKFKDQNCDGCKNRLLDVRYHSKVQSDHFDCYHCGKRFFSYRDLRKHLYNHILRLKCQICDQKCRDRYGLDLHLKTHTGEKHFECPVCKKSFVQSYNLHQHMQIHEQNGKNTCHICFKPLSTKYNLKVHLMSMHKKETKPRCPVCDKWFYTQSALEKHLPGCGKENDEIVEPDFIKIEDVTSLYEEQEEEDDVFVETN